jgi:hypothetical protein
MAGDAIDHFVFAAEAIRRARIDEQIALREALLHLRASSRREVELPGSA